MRLQLRNDKIILDGYVNAVDRFSKVLYDKNGQFIEKILPSVFRRALEKNPSVKILLDHDYDMELANTKDGTANLFEDNIGLRANQVEISDVKTIEKAKQGKLKGWSFGFICNKADEVINKNGIRERIVRDIDLLEVSIIDDKKTPAYIGTSIEMRDNQPTVIEYRNEEFEEDSFSYEKENQSVSNFSEMTASQKRELLNSAYKLLFKTGWLEDYDDSFVYGTIEDNSQLYKMPYLIEDEIISIDNSSQIKVVRGGYKEVRSDKSASEQSLTVKVEKIDYTKYKDVLKKLKEE